MNPRLKTADRTSISSKGCTRCSHHLYPGNPVCARCKYNRGSGRRQAQSTRPTGRG